MSQIARVFPRRTNATPTDALAFTDVPPRLFPPAVDAVHISVTFEWDLPYAEWLAKQWKRVAPVEIGGPATDQRGEEFVSGKYLKPGYVITSRGCPNRCWFCKAWKRDGDIRELPISAGWNVLDDNLLACSESHIRAVFAMLRQQPCRTELTGGLEATRLQDWHVELLAQLRPRPSVFFAYDMPEDLEPLICAGQKMCEAGFTFASHRVRAYVLIGYPGDSFYYAESRLRETARAGFMPMAMLWRDGQTVPPSEWRRFQRSWARPASVNALIRQGV